MIGGELRSVWPTSSYDMDKDYGICGVFVRSASSGAKISFTGGHGHAS